MVMPTTLTHGHSRRGLWTPTYNTWASMVQRCTNPARNNYHLYGGKGVQVCSRWLQFANFLADMGERPKGKTLDREKVAGNYEPGNCKWSTPAEQARNRTSSRLSTEQVHAIQRLRHEFSSRELGKKFGVSKTMILNILNGKAWT